jgi:hypothetical protein
MKRSKWVASRDGIWLMEERKLKSKLAKLIHMDVNAKSQAEFLNEQ